MLILINMFIYPVIFYFPFRIFSYNSKNKRKFFRLFSKKLLRISSRKSLLCLRYINRNFDKKILDTNNIFWSIAHKNKCSAAVVSEFPIGIDIEEYLPFSIKLYEKLARNFEWGKNGDKEIKLFFRYWTAKEAVLKAKNVGLSEISKCFIKDIISEYYMILQCDSDFWKIEHCYFGKYIISIAVKNIDCNVCWFFL